MSRSGTPEAFEKYIEQNIVSILREYADVASSGDKRHWGKVMYKAAHALESSDKRIAELEAERDEWNHEFKAAYKRGTEAERKLAVARRALSSVVTMPRSAESIRRCTQALAQIGGEDAR